MVGRNLEVAAAAGLQAIVGVFCGASILPLPWRASLRSQPLSNLVHDCGDDLTVYCYVQHRLCRLRRRASSALAAVAREPGVSCARGRKRSAGAQPLGGAPCVGAGLRYAIQLRQGLHLLLIVVARCLRDAA